MPRRRGPTLLESMQPHQVAVHISAALATPSGQVLHEFLRVQCQMVPQERQPKLESAEAAVYRDSRRNLFLEIEHYRLEGRANDKT